MDDVFSKITGLNWCCTFIYSCLEKIGKKKPGHHGRNPIDYHHTVQGSTANVRCIHTHSWLELASMPGRKQAKVGTIAPRVFCWFPSRSNHDKEDNVVVSQYGPLVSFGCLSRVFLFLFCIDWDLVILSNSSWKQENNLIKFLGWSFWFARP